ncbi:nitroreductase [Alistipes finegoldii CAG:68]|nr:nitroreductase [Alistipes finegoldii CAG:68]
MMENTIRVNDAICIRCGRCVKVCPSQIFVQEKAGAAVTLHKPENCIVCGHCAAACPTGAVEHADFPAEKVHPIDYAALPTPEQVELLLAVRRSNRAFSQRPVPQEYLDRIVAAADRAPTATNARQLGYTLVTDPAMRREIVEYTLGVFGRIVKRLSNPLVRPWLSRLLPGVYRYIPAFRRMRREYAEQGVDRILRGATPVLFIHAPKESRFGAEDANLAYQNASLTAESLGVSQVYMGFVLTAVRQDGKGGLNRMLGLRDRRICAVMALGMPQFRYPNYIDRKEPEVRKI